MSEARRLPGLKSSVFGAGFALGTSWSVQARCLLSEAHIRGHYQSGFLGLSYRGDVRNVRLELVDENKSRQYQVDAEARNYAECGLGILHSGCRGRSNLLAGPW